MPRQRTPEEITMRDMRKFRQSLRKLSDDVRAYLAWMDEEMKKPSDNKRGERIAQASNTLEMQNDIIRRFTLQLKN